MNLQIEDLVWIKGCVLFQTEAINVCSNLRCIRYIMVYGWDFHFDFACRRILRKILCWVYLSVVTSITLLVLSNGCKEKMSARFAKPLLSHLTHNMKYSVLRVWWVKRKETILFLLYQLTICWQLYHEWFGASLSLHHLLKGYLDWPATHIHLSIYIQRFASS